MFLSFFSQFLNGFIFGNVNLASFNTVLDSRTVSCYGKPLIFFCYIKGNCITVFDFRFPINAARFQLPRGHLIGNGFSVLV
ncbi:hypothetical protein HMPREF9083_0637, partial [Dialister micraerophilus DSM 19965]